MSSKNIKINSLFNCFISKSPQKPTKAHCSNGFLFSIIPHMADIPTKEPTEFTQGELVKWYRQDLSDYPADTWTLTYEFVGAANKQVVATADGLTFLATITAANSADYTAGAYWWQAFVTSGSERYQVDSGKLTVNTDLAGVDTDTYDGRSHNKIVLDALKAVQENRATHADTQVSISTEHGSKAITFLTLEELESAIDRYQAKYNRELRGKGSRVIFQY